MAYQSYEQTLMLSTGDAGGPRGFNPAIHRPPQPVEPKLKFSYDPKLDRPAVLNMRDPIQQYHKRRHEHEMIVHIAQQPGNTKSSDKKDINNTNSLDRPTVVELTFSDEDARRIFNQNPYVFACATLIESQQSESGNWTVAYPPLAGSTTASKHRVKRSKQDGTDAAFCVFQDIVPRKCGRFRLQISVYEQRQTEMHPFAQLLQRVITDPFVVYPMKKQYSYAMTTPFTKLLCDGGVKIKNRKSQTKKRRRTNSPRAWTTDDMHGPFGTQEASCQQPGDSVLGRLSLTNTMIPFSFGQHVYAGTGQPLPMMPPSTRPSFIHDEQAFQQTSQTLYDTGDDGAYEIGSTFRHQLPKYSMLNYTVSAPQHTQVFQQKSPMAMSTYTFGRASQEERSLQQSPETAVSPRTMNAPGHGRSFQQPPQDIMSYTGGAEQQEQVLQQSSQNFMSSFPFGDGQGGQLNVQYSQSQTSMLPNTVTAPSSFPAPMLPLMTGASQTSPLPMLPNTTMVSPAFQTPISPFVGCLPRRSQAQAPTLPQLPGYPQSRPAHFSPYYSTSQLPYGVSWGARS